MIVLSVVAAVLVVGGTLAAVAVGRLASHAIGSGRARSTAVQYNADRLTLSPGPVHQYPTSVPGWTSGQPPTATQLSRVDPLPLYWVVLKKQALEPVIENTYQFHQTMADYQEGRGGAYQTSFDYRSKQFTYQTEDLKGDGLYRCIGQQLYFWEPLAKRWMLNLASSGRYNDCHRYQPDSTAVHNSFVNDGMAAGGLTAAEADRFISYLANQKGLFEAAGPSSVSGSDGRRYLQLDVTLAPIPATPNGDRAGALVLRSAFRETGRDPQAWPYNFGAGDGQGKKVTYYLDPTTLLPMYSRTLFTPRLDRDGKPLSGAQGDSVELTQYAFPSTIVPLTLNDHDPFPLSWPFPR